MAFGFLGLLFSQSLGAQSNPSGNEPKIINIDGVVAVVNTGVVTRKEIDDRIASIQKQAPAGGKKLPEGDELRKQVLENLILEKIQIQEDNYALLMRKKLQNKKRVSSPTSSKPLKLKNPEQRLKLKKHLTIQCPMS